MNKKMLIDASQPDETRMAIVSEGKLLEYESEVLKLKPTKGNIYLAKIIRVEPSLQAAFVDYGAQRHGFLAYNEIHPDYFKIPTSDKEKILAAEIETNSHFSSEENIDDDFVIEQEENENKNLKRRKGFLDKVFDFFNYKPTQDEKLFKKLEQKKNTTKQFSKVVPIHKKYSIQEVIKKNQVILIQVVREERGNKGAAVTTRLSLAGKYCVLMPNTSKGGGISRKIFDISLRKRLKEILTSLKINKGMGVIIRTAGQNMKKTDISRDYKALLKLWSQITAKTIKSNAPYLIHEEGNLLKRSVRDYYSSDITEIIVNNKETFISAKDIMKFFMPGFSKYIKLENKNQYSLFASFKIEKQINEMHKPTVPLKSGGYLVINQTEALVAIDINSGRSTRQRNIEDTALKTNLEAAEEIAMQIKLRDLAGLIVIDFIDMLERTNNFKVERKIKDSVKNDRARIQCGRISNFGLMEISRQRLKQVINSAISHKCEHCNGSGVLNTLDFSAMQILRVCEEILASSELKKIQIIVNYNMDNFIKKNKNSFFQSLNKKFKIKIILLNFSEFNDSESLICSNKEILYRNCGNEEKVNNAINFLSENNISDNLEKVNQNSTNKTKKNFQKKNISIKKNRLDKKKKSNIINQSEAESRHNKIEDNIKKRTSFRAKAKDLINSKKKEQVKRSKKKENKIEAIAAIEQNTNKESDSSQKKQGWWNQ